MPSLVHKAPACACNLESSLWALVPFLAGRTDEIHYLGLARHLDRHDMLPGEREALKRRLRQELKL